jgi:hypothetical protein
LTLFQQERLTLGRASSLAGMSQREFQRLLADRRVLIHYGVEEFKQDLEPFAGPPFVDPALCAWLVVEPARDKSRVAQLRTELDAGEAGAIALALERQADLIPVDERLGRQVATALGLRVTGLLGVLAEAKTVRLHRAISMRRDARLRQHHRAVTPPDRL